MRREKRNKQTQVMVAMSGGLDSAVAALLLKKAGFAVIGVFMKFWSEPTENGLVGMANRCCSPAAEVRARKVAKILKIPFYVFDFSEEFKKRIVNSFLNNYQKGITPNPCVLCNREIKFGLLLKKALALGVKYVATGHYARIKREKEKFYLLKAKDKNKDQSYFLWMLNQAQLRRILLPIGDYTRAEVENLARKFRLPVLKARKSVEICFIQTASPPVGGRGERRDFSLRTTINDFLKRYLKEKPGKIIDAKGKILGQHCGLWFYTIGQRKGIGLPGGPFWVLDKNIKKNFLIVTKNEKDLYKKELICKNVNWVLAKEPKLPLKVQAKIRYRHTSVPAKIIKLSRRQYRVIFNQSQRAITPGQSVVFYQGQELLGGGIIK
ncbi:MAG: tRNA 2-thiouridine(34) synthase MnmA [Minisyncoccales bacterium]